MAFDTIRAGIKVFTNARAFIRNGRIGTVGGNLEGVIDRVIRHPLSRNILAVVVAPDGVTDPDRYVVVSARNLRERTA